MDDSSLVIKPFRVLEEPPELFPSHPGKQNAIQEDLMPCPKGGAQSPVFIWWENSGMLAEERRASRKFDISHLLPAVITEGKSGKISIIEIFGIQVLPHRQNLK